MLKPEREVPRRLPPRGVNQPQMGVVEEESDGNTGLAQQALQARMRRRAPASLLIGERLVEVGAGGDEGDEGQVGNRVGRRQAVVVLGQSNRQRFREVRASWCAGQKIARPLEDLGRELEECVDARLVGVCVCFGFRDLAEPRLRLGAALAVDAYALLGEDVRGHDEAHLLDLAQPLLVDREFGWILRHRFSVQRTLKRALYDENGYEEGHR